jgi:hypothetical protein
MGMPIDLGDAISCDAGNNDEFMASMLPESTGFFDYAYRYTTTNGRAACRRRPGRLEMIRFC